MKEHTQIVTTRPVVEALKKEEAVDAITQQPKHRRCPMYPVKQPTVDLMQIRSVQQPILVWLEVMPAAVQRQSAPAFSADR